VKSSAWDDCSCYQPAGRRYWPTGSGSSGDWGAPSVLDHHGPCRAHELRPAVWVLGRERSHLDASDIGAVLDVVHTARGHQCLQVDILVGLALRVGSAVNPRGAVHDVTNLSARPVRAPSGQIRGQGTQIKPAPAWAPTAAQTSRAVVQVETVYVHSDTHQRKLALIQQIPC